MNLKEKYLGNKRVVVEVILVIIFIFFVLKYLGIPDIYDNYIYWFLGFFLAFNIIIYLGFVKKELQEILKDRKNEE